jgi:hypothetical protein
VPPEVDSEPSAASQSIKFGDSRAVERGRTSSAKNDEKQSLEKPPLRGGEKMTAEIAILNKSAVALAADSAVTIQSGSKEEKTYDSADKLFELCHANAIAIMIYNGLNFAEVPLQILIKKFRSECSRFDRVEDAAQRFLEYLQKFGSSAPSRVKEDASFPL